MLLHPLCALDRLHDIDRTRGNEYGLQDVHELVDCPEMPMLIERLVEMNERLFDELSTSRPDELTAHPFADIL